MRKGQVTLYEVDGVEEWLERRKRGESTVFVETMDKVRRWH